MAIAAEIRSRIARGDLVAGDLLPVESSLTAEFGCSKPVVREALRILETEGLVEVKRGLGGGPRVRHPSISDAAKTMGIYLQVGDVAVLDVWTARDRIVAAAVERLVGVDLTPLKTEVDALAASVGDLETFNRHMLDVGEVAVQLAGNATEHALVAALRHIVEAQVTAATSTVTDAVGMELARIAESTIAAAWQDALAHLQAAHPHAARQSYEDQAEALRGTIAGQMVDLTVGEVSSS
jgi:GntR family transcriptional repressor for pyruvate dehydrogenase complex